LRRVIVTLDDVDIGLIVGPLRPMVAVTLDQLVGYRAVEHRIRTQGAGIDSTFQTNRHQHEVVDITTAAQLELIDMEYKHSSTRSCG
jgi:hypothetical protein